MALRQGKTIILESDKYAPRELSKPARQATRMLIGKTYRGEKSFTAIVISINANSANINHGRPPSDKTLKFIFSYLIEE